jgi:hypothetical protein
MKEIQKFMKEQAGELEKEIDCLQTWMLNHASTLGEEQSPERIAEDCELPVPTEKDLREYSKKMKVRAWSNSCIGRISCLVSCR